MAAPTPPLRGRGGCPRTGRGVAKKASRQTFFKKYPPIKVHPTPLLKRVVLEKNIFSPFTTIVVSPAIAGGIVACFHGLCEAGTQIKAIKGFVGTPCRVAGKFTRAALHAK